MLAALLLAMGFEYPEVAIATDRGSESKMFVLFTQKWRHCPLSFAALASRSGVRKMVIVYKVSDGNITAHSDSDSSNNSSEECSPPQRRCVQKDNKKTRRLKKNRCENNKTDLYVVRIRTDGMYGNAKPCFECMNAIRGAGIRRVYYTTDEQTLKRENVKEMTSFHLSHFQMRRPNGLKKYWYF